MSRKRKPTLDDLSALSSRELTMRALRQGARGERFARWPPTGVFTWHDGCTHGRMFYVLR